MKFKICPEYRLQRLKRDVRIVDNDRFICLFVNDDRTMYVFGGQRSGQSATLLCVGRL